MPYEPSKAEIAALAWELATSPDYDTGTDYKPDAAWILSRFVRRDREHGLLAELCEENERLRAELRGQRCDGSGWMRRVVPADIHGRAPCNEGEGCPACKPDATPKADRCEHDWTSSSSGTPVCLKCNSDGSRDREVVSEAGAAASEPRVSPSAPQSAAPVTSITPESMSLLEHHCSDADFETIGKMRDESYAAGYSAGRDDAARLNIQEVVHVTKLHEDTVRALVTGLLMAPTRQDATPVAPWTERARDLAETLLAKLKETRP